MSKIRFGDFEEDVVTREEFSLERAKEVLSGGPIAIIGYGIQGPAQALNLRDNGFQVIVGVRKGESYDKAIRDGFVEGATLFDVETACSKSNTILYLLSDAGQVKSWPTVKPYLTKGKLFCLSSGFLVTYKSATAAELPADIDVVVMAPKGSGTSVRRLFLAKQGINSSYAVHQDATGKALDRVCALGIGVGSGYLFKTSSNLEAHSDLVGERGTLIGALQGMIAAQYELLRSKGHSPSEAFNETVEELTQSLVPLVGENGMDWMMRNCSTTAQAGALKWYPHFRDAVRPVFEKLYDEVESGREAKEVVESLGSSDYRHKLEEDLQKVQNHECWRVGKVVRSLRPKLS